MKYFLLLQTTNFYGKCTENYRNIKRTLSDFLHLDNDYVFNILDPIMKLLKL